jgi:hypothetical protein
VTRGARGFSVNWSSVLVPLSHQQPGAFLWLADLENLEYWLGQSRQETLVGSTLVNFDREFKVIAKCMTNPLHMSS